MQHIVAWACGGGGGHAVSGPCCSLHTNETPVLVNDLYVCSTGKPHVCNGTECIIKQGTCCITGAPVQQPVSGNLATETKGGGGKSRRRKSRVYTDNQIACAFVYDLLFSNRRLRYEAARYKACLELSRRLCQRYVRDMAKENKPVSMQLVVQVFYGNRDKLRSMTYLDDYSSMKRRQEICEKYARVVGSFWSLLSPYVSHASSFETVVSAVLYMMRRGIAYDGIMVIPPDKWLADALPDAHSIREVGVQRRQFTQIKNTISAALRSAIDQKFITAVNVAECFQNVP